MATKNGQDDDSESPFPWHEGVFDAHCHPTDSMEAIDEIPKMKSRVLTIMATRSQDQTLVADVADSTGLRLQSLDYGNDIRTSPCKVLPSFGWHPWFSHQLYDDHNRVLTSPPTKIEHYKSSLSPPPEDESFIVSLTEPKSLSEYMERTRQYLEKYPTAIIGEIGLDRSFRIPLPDAPPHDSTEPGLTPGGREGRQLSPYRVDLGHQRKILKAQLDLAGEMQRAVSVHGVGAHGVLFEALQETWQGHANKITSKRERKRRASVKDAHGHENNGYNQEVANVPAKPYPPRICLHSYSGPPEALKQYLHSSVPVQIFFSFSQVINFSTSASSKALAVIKAVPSDRILVESDLHRAGERMDDLLESMVRLICKAKDWTLDNGTRQLARNWKVFALGSPPDSSN